MTGIYVIRRLSDGVCYVGSSVHVEARWVRHRKLLSAGKHHSPHLQRSWLKYGASAHEFVLLEPCAPDVLIAVEQCYIDSLRPLFNVSRTAGSNKGVVHSPEMRTKCSAWQLGRRLPDVTRQKMRAARLGRKHSLATRQKIGRSQIGNTRGLGVRKTPTQIDKSRHFHLGRKRSPETCARMREAWNNRRAATTATRS